MSFKFYQEVLLLCVCKAVEKNMDENHWMFSEL